MKSGGLAQVVFYTCWRPRAGSAGGHASISMPSSDWCLCRKRPSTIGTRNLSVSIRPPVYLCVTSPTIHLSFLPFLCLNVALSLYFRLHIDLAHLSLWRHSQPLVCFFSGRWKSSVCGDRRWKMEGLFMRHWHIFSGADGSPTMQIKATSDEREINFKGARVWKKVSGSPALTIKQMRSEKMIVVPGTADHKRPTTADFEWSRSLCDGGALSNNSVHGSRADARRPSRTFPSFTQQLSTTLLVNWKRDKNPLWI